MNEYLKQAKDFLTAHNAKIDIVFDHRGKYWDDDKQARNIYKFTITRGEKSYTGKFGDSVHNTEKLAFWKEQLKRGTNSPAKCKKEIKEYTPNVYDILAAVQKYETPSDTWEFANEFDYKLIPALIFARLIRFVSLAKKNTKQLATYSRTVS